MWRIRILAYDVPGSLKLVFGNGSKLLVLALQICIDRMRKTSLVVANLTVHIIIYIIVYIIIITFSFFYLYFYILNQIFTSCK